MVNYLPQCLLSWLKMTHFWHSGVVHYKVVFHALGQFCKTGSGSSYRSCFCSRISTVIMKQEHKKGVSCKLFSHCNCNSQIICVGHISTISQTNHCKLYTHPLFNKRKAFQLGFNRVVTSFHTAASELSKHKQFIHDKSPYMYPNVVHDKTTMLFRCILFSRLLECSVQDIERILNQYYFLEHLGFDIVEEKVNTMKAYNVPANFILENPRLLYQTSAPELSRRLKLFKDSLLFEAKHVLDWNNLAHHLECKNVVFESGFQYLLAKMEAFEGFHSQQEYLQFRLGCSKVVVDRIFSSYPLNRNKMSQMKMKRLLDFFLVEVGQSSEFVIKYTRLFTFSMTRLRQRWYVIQAAGIKSEKQMVYVWMLSESRFQDEYSSYTSDERNE